MKRTILIFSTVLILLGLAGFAWAQCPEDTVDSGICDTMYVEGYPPDLFVSPPGPYFVRVPIYVTHDVPNPMIDSIAGFIIPLCYSHTNPTKYCSLSSWWNNTDLYPLPTDRSIFRHLDEETNWMMDLSEQSMGYEWDHRNLWLDGTSHFWFATAPTGVHDQSFGPGSRVLLATMTFKLEDTMTVCMDSCFWPPASHLTFTRSDGKFYVPRHFLPDTFYITGGQPGDNCDLPIEIDLPADLPYADSGQTNCGRGDNYDSTCLGYFDGGEDIIYELTVTSPVEVDIVLDPKGTTYTGIALDDDCPLNPYTCLYESTNMDGSPHGFSDIHLEPGTYYIMIDTWPTPTCIPDFDLTITSIVSNYTFEQQNFLDPDGVVVVPNSDWGFVSFDIFPVDDGVVRYLCISAVIGADTGWIVRNYPVLPSEFIDPGRFGLDFDFGELGISSGTDVSFLEFSYLVTTTLQTSGPEGPYTTIPVYDLNFQAFGGEVEGGGSEYEGPGTLVPPYYTEEVDKDSLIKNKGLFLDKVPSVQEGHGECESGATARSLKWLSNKHGLGLGSAQDIQKELDNPEYMDQGVTLREMVAAKKKYIKDKGLPLEVHYWYSESYYGPHPDWHNTPGTPSESSDDIDFIEWLWREMKKGQDIEIAILWGNSDESHCVTVVGLDKKNREIEYRDDETQGDTPQQQAKGDKEVKPAKLVPIPGLNGEYGYKNAANKIFRAIAESPKPHKWSYHPRIVNGTLTVFGTINCETSGDPLFSGYVVVCHEYSGSVPLWANDLIAIFEWDATCDNVNGIKVAAPELQDGVWRLPPLYDWFVLNLPRGPDLVLPSIGDSTGIIQYVYVVVDLAEWLADPRPLQETYDVIDGECDDLPGYLIGTTPITFDSLAGPEENPFQTTPLTGTLVWDGELIFAHDTTEGCCQFDTYCDMMTEYDCMVTGGTWYPPPYQCIDDVCQIYCGDCTQDGVIDLGDVVYLINYIFRGGPAPDPVCIGDVNCNGVVDLGDVVYLINYVFRAGEPPCEECCSP